MSVWCCNFQRQAWFCISLVNVNKVVYRNNGERASDFDIVLESAIIEVKSGKNAGKIISQMQGTIAEAMAIDGKAKFDLYGYIPGIHNGTLNTLRKDPKAAGLKITNNLDELLDWIGNKR